MALISPRTPSGVMELLPRQQIAFQRLLDTIRRGYERFGFLPVETPAFERVDVLLTKSGGETEKQVYFVQSTGGRQQGHPPDIALRFDLTVPLARYVAEHERELAFPFRRYQMQRVYRGERAQKGRFREFYQCDIDVIGKDGLSFHYDAEIPAIIHAIFRELDFGPFTININNRKILLGFLEAQGIADPEIRTLVLREIDKIDKIGREAVQESLTGPAVGLSAGVAERILALITLSGGHQAVLAALRQLSLDHPLFQTGLQELATVVEGLAALRVPETVVRLNLAIARGLDYYTGTVYETFLDDFPGIGSVCSGGRYDNLASHYTRSHLPGVGISIGVTRLFSQLLEAGRIDTNGCGVDVMISQQDPALMSRYLSLAADLREAGLRTEVHLENAKLARQFKYADRVGIPFVVVLGEEEARQGTAVVKDLRHGRQETVAQAELPARLRALVADPSLRCLPS